MYATPRSLQQKVVERSNRDFKSLTTRCHSGAGLSGRRSDVIERMERGDKELCKISVLVVVVRRVGVCGKLEEGGGRWTEGKCRFYD